MSIKQQPTTPEGKFGAQIQAMIDAALKRQRFVIPVFTADPPETDPTNLWMRYDGRLRGRYRNGGGTYTYIDYPMRTDITSPPAVPAYPSAPSLAPAPQSYATSFQATWSQTYLGTGAKRTDVDGELNLVVGQDPAGSNGQQKALFGFDGAAMVTALASSTIQRVELTVTMLASYQSVGTTTFYGMHNLTAEPSTYDPSSAILRYGASSTITVGQARTFQLPIAYGQQLRAGTAKGLLLEALTGEKAHYAMYAGFGGSYPPPILTVTYAK